MKPRCQGCFFTAKNKPGATTSVKDTPCPFLGTPVTLYPMIGPCAGLHLTVTLLSFTSVTSISDGDSTPGRRDGTMKRRQRPSERREKKTVSVTSTCFVCDVDRSAGGGTVSSAGHGVDRHGVVGAGVKVRDCSSGFRAGYRELLRVTVTSWTTRGRVRNICLSIG